MTHFNLKRSFIYSLIAFAVHGWIAYMANDAYALKSQLRATFGNAFFAMAMTFVSTLTMEFFFRIPRKPLTKYLFSFSASGSLVLILITSLHYILETPNMVGTIFYSALVSLPYYLLFPLLLLYELRNPKDLKKATAESAHEPI